MKILISHEESTEIQGVKLATALSTPPNVAYIDVVTVEEYLLIFT